MGRISKIKKILINLSFKTEPIPSVKRKKKFSRNKFQRYFFQKTKKFEKKVQLSPLIKKKKRK